MKALMKLGVVDRTVLVFIPDPASTDGSGKTGLVAANLTVSYTRVETDNDVVLVDATGSLNNLGTLLDAHTDWGLLEVSSALAPGVYRLDLADAVFAAGAWFAVVYVMITTSAAAASPMEFELVAFDPLDTVRLGLTALPNAAADAAGGLPISDAGGLDLDAIYAAVVTEMAQVLALLDDPRTEPAQGAPPVNPDAMTKLDYLYKFLRNKITQSATELKIFADDAVTVDHKSTVSDDGTTYTRGEIATGP
jgi:hypothetical protein